MSGHENRFATANLLVRNRGCIRYRGSTRGDRLISELSVTLSRESLVHPSDCYEFLQQIEPIGCGRQDEDDEADETDEEDEADEVDEEDEAGEEDEDDEADDENEADDGDGKDEDEDEGERCR